MNSALPLLSSFAIVLAGALLFTNAVEWPGQRLGLGQSAVGSLLAAGGDRAAGVGDPGRCAGGRRGRRRRDHRRGDPRGAFLLATLAMALVGAFAFLYRHRRPQGISLAGHAPTLARDLGSFLVFLTCVLVVGMVSAPHPVRVAVAVLLLVAYAV